MTKLNSWVAAFADNAVFSAVETVADAFMSDKTVESAVDAVINATEIIEYIDNMLTAFDGNDFMVDKLKVLRAQVASCAREWVVHYLG